MKKKRFMTKTKKCLYKKAVCTMRKAKRKAFLFKAHNMKRKAIIKKSLNIKERHFVYLFSRPYSHLGFTYFLYIVYMFMECFCWG